MCLARRASGLSFAARFGLRAAFWLFRAAFGLFGAALWLFAAWLGLFAAWLRLGASGAVCGAVGNRASSAARFILIAWLRACWAGSRASLFGAAFGFRLTGNLGEYLTVVFRRRLRLDEFALEVLHFIELCS